MLHIFIFFIFICNFPYPRKLNDNEKLRIYGIYTCIYIIYIYRLKIRCFLIHSSSALPLKNRASIFLHKAHNCMTFIIRLRFAAVLIHLIIHEFRITEVPNISTIYGMPEDKGLDSSMGTQWNYAIMDS